MDPIEKVLREISTSGDSIRDAARMHTVNHETFRRRLKNGNSLQERGRGFSFTKKEESLIIHTLLEFADRVVPLSRGVADLVANFVIRLPDDRNQIFNSKGATQVSVLFRFLLPITPK